MFRRLVLVGNALLLVGACGGGERAHRPQSGDLDASTDAGSSEEEPVVTQCPTPVAPASAGVCDVTAGAADRIALRGDVLAPDAVYVDGTVVIEGDAITCVGCDCDPAGATVISCAGAAISPGLINPHDHLNFTEGEPVDHGANRYEHRHDWRGSLPAPTNPHGTGPGSAGMRWGEVRMLLAGVTSMVGSGRADNLIRNLDQLSQTEKTRGLVQLKFETFSLGDSGEQYHADCDWNYKLTELEVADLPGAYLPHVAEGIDDYAAEEFRCQSSSFDNGQDYTEHNATHIHSIGLHADDYDKMARDGARLIWSPRSNVSLYGHTAQVTVFSRLGGTIALGTDWTYSGSANLLRELACADQLNRDYLDGAFSDAQLWRMATSNAALSTGNDDLLGSLAVGKLADVAVFGGGSARYHRAVIEAGNENVALVLRGGRPLYGETDVVDGLGEACDPIAVCGDERSICASRELGGTTYAQLEAQVADGNAAYPALFCGGAPADEPTCTPSRPGEFTGALTAGDSDGDGIANPDDNCPRVFNPIRPIDGGNQTDIDGDGAGDACDPAPLLPDLDGDGKANDADNCPYLANPAQTDGDGDGKGDPCDFCPTVPNPISVCAGAPGDVVTINAIQTGQVAPGTNVTIRGAVVSAVWTGGVWAQDPGGGPNSGIHLFSGKATSVQVGDLVDATGEVLEYFGDTEVDGATIQKSGTGTAPAPIPLTVAQAASEAYEGVLVRLTDVTDVVNPYACSADSASCTDPALWLVNDSIAVWNRSYQDADWTTHAGATGVTGVMTYRYDRRRIMPRRGGDLTP